MDPTRIRAMIIPRPLRTAGRVTLLLATLMATATVVVVANRANAAVPEHLPPSYTYTTQDDELKEGPLDLSGNCPESLTGAAFGVFQDHSLVTWEVESSLGSGSKVFPGTEWTLKVLIDAPSPKKGFDGVHPLKLEFVPTGPLEKVGGVSAVYDKKYNHGNLKFKAGYATAKAPWGTWGYEYSSYSDPSILQQGDGASLTMEVKVRATEPGEISLSHVRLTGHEWGSSNNPQYEHECTADVGWKWTVLAPEAPVAAPDAATIDARYSAISAGEANGGSHQVRIDVLANDDDPNTPQGPGTKSQVRIGDWSATSKLGGTVSCGTDAQKNLPPGTPLLQLSAQDCFYTPPVNMHGVVDTFTYRLHHLTDDQTSFGTVTVLLVPNLPPAGGTTAFATGTGQDETFDIAPTLASLDGDPHECLPELVSAPNPLVGTVTLHPDCSFDWDNINGAFSGSVQFTYEVCDTHPTRTAPDLGPNVARAAGYHLGEPDDLSETTSRKCRTPIVTISILPGLLAPPVGVTDVDVVDTGYASDGLGAYSLSIPVLANDYDINGPDPSMPSAMLTVLDPPDPSEGTATVVDDEIVFTPADGFSGPVDFTYRVCEDPFAQDPPYTDDPDTPFYDEGLPVCGVGTVALQVIGNDPPVPGPDQLFVVTDDVITGYDVAANDADPEGGNLTCSPGPVVASEPSLVETASIDAGCLLDVDPVDGTSGPVELSYEVCDVHSLAVPSYPAVPYGADGSVPGSPAPRCAIGVATVTIIAPLVVVPEDPDAGEHEPECVSDVAQVGAGESVEIDVLVNDSDLDAEGEPSGLTVFAPGDAPGSKSAKGGVAAGTPDAGAVTYEPPAEFSGSDTFTYTAIDTAGFFCQGEVTVEVLGTSLEAGPGSPAAGPDTLPQTGASSTFALVRIAIGLLALGAATARIARWHR